jgi:hypothetical protein
MKVLVELDIDLELYDGHTMTPAEIESQIQHHLNDVFDPEFREESIIEPYCINVPTTMCWDCYSYIFI